MDEDFFYLLFNDVTKKYIGDIEKKINNLKIVKILHYS